MVDEGVLFHRGWASVGARGRGARNHGVVMPLWAMINGMRTTGSCFEPSVADECSGETSTATSLGGGSASACVEEKQTAAPNWCSRALDEDINSNCDGW